MIRRQHLALQPPPEDHMCLLNVSVTSQWPLPPHPQHQWCQRTACGQQGDADTRQSLGFLVYGRQITVKVHQDAAHKGRCSRSNYSQLKASWSCRFFSRMNRVRKPSRFPASQFTRQFASWKISHQIQVYLADMQRAHNNLCASSNTHTQ